MLITQVMYTASSPPDQQSISPHLRTGEENGLHTTNGFIYPAYGLIIIKVIFSWYIRLNWYS